jgi:hypothetical protein
MPFNIIISGLPGGHFRPVQLGWVLDEMLVQSDKFCYSDL